MKPGRPTIQLPKGYKPPNKLVGKIKDDYMGDVIFLKDLSGKIRFRGTRRGCVRYVKAQAPGL